MNWRAKEKDKKKKKKKKKRKDENINGQLLANKVNKIAIQKSLTCCFFTANDERCEDIPQKQMNKVFLRKKMT